VSDYFPIPSRLRQRRTRLGIRNVAEGRKPSIWNVRRLGSRLAHDAGALGRDVN
jgi:hypothetical protein